MGLCCLFEKCRSLIPTDVDARWLAEVEFIVGSLFQKVEHSVLKDELHEFDEGLLHVHAFSEKFFPVDAGD